VRLQGGEEGGVVLLHAQVTEEVGMASKWWPAAWCGGL
jgi:hypothetical protein